MLRYVAARALGRLGDVRATPALEEVVGDTLSEVVSGDSVHRVVVEALAQIRERGSQSLHHLDKNTEP